MKTHVNNITNNISTVVCMPYYYLNFLIPYTALTNLYKQPNWSKSIWL